MSKEVDTLLTALEMSNNPAPPPYTIEKLDIINGVRFNHSLHVLTFDQVRGLVKDAIDYQKDKQLYMTLIEVEGVPFAITSESDAKTSLELLGIHVYRKALHNLRYNVSSESELMLWLSRFMMLSTYFENTEDKWSEVYDCIHKLLNFNSKTHAEVDAYIAGTSSLAHRHMLKTFRKAWFNVP